MINVNAIHRIRFDFHHFCSIRTTLEEVVHLFAQPTNVLCNTERNERMRENTVRDGLLSKCIYLKIPFKMVYILGVCSVMHTMCMQCALCVYVWHASFSSASHRPNV